MRQVRQSRLIRQGGLTLLETSVALSILALFIAVFISLTARLANAQKQQESRAAALSVLESQVALLREQPASTWKSLESVSWKQNGVDYSVTIRLLPGDSDVEQGFGVFQGTVTWRSVTGLRSIRREFWVHERID